MSKFKDVIIGRGYNKFPSSVPLDQYKESLDKSYTLQSNAVFQGWGGESVVRYDIGKMSGLPVPIYGIPEATLNTVYCHKNLNCLTGSVSLVDYYPRDNAMLADCKDFFDAIFNEDTSPYRKVFSHLILHKNEKGEYLSLICPDYQNVPIHLFTNLLIHCRSVTGYKLGKVFSQLLQAGFKPNLALFWLPHFRELENKAYFYDNPCYGDIAIDYHKGSSPVLFSAGTPNDDEKTIKQTLNNPCNMVWYDKLKFWNYLYASLCSLNTKYYELLFLEHFSKEVIEYFNDDSENFTYDVKAWMELKGYKA